MKKAYLFFLLFATIFLMQAQINNFPETGDALLSGSFLKMERPNTSTSWARGIFHYQFGDINTRIGGYGMYGTSSTLHSMYFAFGNNPWNSGQGLYLLPNGNIGIGTTTPYTKLEILSGENDGSNPPIFRLTSNDINAENNQLLGEIQFYNGDLDGKHISSFIRSLAADAYGRKGQLAFGTTGTYSTNAVERMRINENGNVGIGTTNPQYTLDVKGAINTPTFLLSDNFGDLRMRRAANNDPVYRRALVPDYDETTGFSELTINYGGDFNDGVRFNGAKVIIDGNVGIGTTNPDEKLTVKGKIHAQEVRVDLTVPGPDYVFEKYYTGESTSKSDYEMPTLEEVEAFIKDNYHLSEMPSAKEMESNGVNLKDMNLKLLQKIEELTLYTIQQQKEIEKIKILEEKLQKLEAIVNKL